MPEQSIPPLEQQLIDSHEQIAQLTLANAELTKRLSDAETRNKKLKRSARNDETVLRDQLATAQSRRS